ncbi:YhfG family protein [Pseudomonas sp. KNUC1026]|uniref:YhfG family protein n=1 Tax=Pseudomonas sp. KNUC1026 TaxID=2893890 RepID=UPI001F29F8DA|nr:YhfG family protein [Pseudomonas sp. KNUC1026]UFH48298.1 YhfG family protein [Pseudomonas sp. KNUC1026]
MPTSLETKRAYFAKVRRANYAASLRLEGFNVPQGDEEKPVPTREQVLQRYRTDNAR